MNTSTEKTKELSIVLTETQFAQISKALVFANPLIQRELNIGPIETPKDLAKALMARRIGELMLAVNQTMVDVIETQIEPFHASKEEGGASHE